MMMLLFLSISIAVAALDFPGQADLITSLPGQPIPKLSFDLYSGYLTINETTGKRFFYYFVEASAMNASDAPLVRWFNGGPGCSSLGGGFEELGPLIPNANGTLDLNPYAWNHRANVLFIESPTGVGWSYSKSDSDYTSGDASTAADNYVATQKFLEKFPQYKGRDFYLAGESYAGMASRVHV